MAQRSPLSESSVDDSRYRRPTIEGPLTPFHTVSMGSSHRRPPIGTGAHGSRWAHRWVLCFLCTVQWGSLSVHKKSRDGGRLMVLGRGRAKNAGVTSAGDVASMSSLLK
jgi:hypothetical protein